MARPSYGQLRRAQHTVRAKRATFVDADGAWHRVVPGSEECGTFILRCSGVRRTGRIASDLPAQDVCPVCTAYTKESELNR